MSGGSWKYMASFRSGTYGSSGFISSTLKAYNSKYYDEYSSLSDWTKYSKRILGDATGEMGPFYYYQDADGNNRSHNSWYADASYFVQSSAPWFYRGGYYTDGVLAGQFYFHRYTGSAHGSFGFRLVLIR